MAMNPAKPIRKPDKFSPGEPAISHLWLRSLDEIEGPDLPLVGGKAFRLATLKQHGLPVPPGLVLTTRFFQTHLQKSKLIPLWAGSPDIAVTAEALAWLADALKTKPLSKKLIDALAAEIDRLFDPAVDGFAVRSSAIDEDQRDHTFAGIHLTELGVPRAALPIAISRCWASALSGPAIEYRQVHGMSIQGIQVAVFIQPMLAPQYAGVGFTVNPLTGGRDEMVIEATWGLGDPLVSGEIQPHFYRFSNQPPEFPLLEERRGNTNQSDERGPLSTGTRLQLAGELNQIEALMGEPQDVEWARHNNKFYYLQTRPVTAVSEPLQTSPDQLWTRGTYPESLPEIPSPLYGSLLERAQPQVMDFFLNLGFDPNGVTLYQRVILGRPYINLSLLKRLAAQIGLNLDGLLQSIGYLRMTTSAGPLAVDWRTAWQTRAVYRKVIARIRAARRDFEQTHARIEELAKALSPFNPTAPADVLLHQLRQQDEIYLTLFQMSLQLEISLAITAGAGSHLMPTPAGTPFAAMTAMVMQQQAETERDEMIQAMVALSQLAEDDPELQAYLLHAPRGFSDFAENPAVSPEFRQGFAGVIAQFGERSTFDGDPGWPRYREEPAILLRIAQQFVKQPPPVTSASAVFEKPPWYIWRRWAIGPLSGKLRQLLSIRNQLNITRAKGMAATRAWNLALGVQWVEQGWLEEAQDIFWLTLDEIERTLMIGKNASVTLSSTVRARKETAESNLETVVPFNLQQSQLLAIQLGGKTSDAALSDVTVGLPVSPGQARGSVVVVHQPDEVSDLGDDTILVMPSTGSDWLPLLHLARGLIVETGGLLSHGSVIAREYGLPAVANIPQATRRFQTGDKVLLDGSTGVIQLLEANERMSE